jgi:hypothetical protein
VTDLISGSSWAAQVFKEELAIMQVVMVFGDLRPLLQESDGQDTNNMCTALNIIFYCLIIFSFFYGAISWIAVQRYSASVAKHFSLEKDLVDTRAGNDSGASAFEIEMFKEIMTKKYLQRGEDIIRLGVKSRIYMLTAIGSGTAAVIFAGFNHIACK